MKNLLGILSMIIGFLGAGALIIWSFVILITTIVAFANGVNEVSLFLAILFFILRDFLAGLVAIIFIGIGQALLE